MRFMFFIACFVIGIQALAGEKPVPSNNNWSGFPVGSWIEFERHQTEAGGVPKLSKEKMILFSFDPTGPAKLESFSFQNEKWVRHEHSSNSTAGCVVSLNGLERLSDSDEEKVIATAEGIKRYKETFNWKMEQLANEVVEIGGRKFDCKVRQWRNDVDDRRQRLKAWFCDEVSVPKHLEFFGPYILTVCTTPNLLKIEWALNDADPFSASVLSLKEPLNIEGKTLECVKWQSNARGGKTVSWFHDSIPGRIAKFDSQERGTSFGETVLRYRSHEKPLPASAVKPVESSWVDFGVGSWVEYSLSSTRKQTPKEQRIKTKLLGFTEDGYPYLESTHIEGDNKGCVINELEMPMSTIEQKRVTVTNKKAFTYKQIVPLMLETKAIEFKCEDEWKREWGAALIKKEGEKLPLRHFRSWFVTATLDTETLVAIAEVEGQVLTRQVVSLDDVISLGDRKIRCVKELESLQAPRGQRRGVYRTSREVPGHIVHYAIDQEEGKDSFQLIDFKLEPKP